MLTDTPTTTLDATPTDWRTVAIAAHRALEEARANRLIADEIETAQREREKLQGALNKLFPEKIRPAFVFSEDGRIATAPDGVKFYTRIEWDGVHTLTLLVICPDCKEEIPTEGIYDLTSLGSELESPRLRRHNCHEMQVSKGLLPPKPEAEAEPAPTQGAGLEELIRLIAREEIHDWAAGNVPLPSASD